MVVEITKWIKADSIDSQFAILVNVNRNLLIALSSVILVITPLTLITAKKATKDVGWDVYKKIGCSTEIQSK